MRGFILSSLLALNFAPLALGTSNKGPVVFPVKLTWERGAPDGFERDMIFVNGQFPGPLLSLDEGDDVEFVVENFLPFGTTMHFHGIEQFQTPWSDGVPGLSQKVIEPGCTFIYKWTATQYGTYWYHGHSKGQVEDGLLGPINIRPANGSPHPFNMISNDTDTINQLEDAMYNPEVVVLSDWSHFTSEEIRNISRDANIDALCGDSILVNGQGSVQCPGVPFLMGLLSPQFLPLLDGQNLTDKGCVPLTDELVQGDGTHDYSLVPPGLFSGCNVTETSPAIINVDSDKGWASLNLISTASLQEMTVSIDDHPMWVYAVDGRYIEPKLVDAMTLQHGSRHSVFIQLNQPCGSYTLRVAGSGLNQKIFGSGTVSYAPNAAPATPNPSINYAGTNTTANVTFLKDSAVAPFPPIQPAQDADQTFVLLLNRTGPAWQWTLNDAKPFNESLETLEPLLWDPKGLDGTNLVIKTKNGTWVDFVFIVTNTSGSQPPHPIHKHSNKGHIIGQGTGNFNYSSVADAIKEIPQSFNLDNPPYRDTFYTPPVISVSTWMAVRYQVVNPGAFLIHCHINPHLTGGMALAILDGVDEWPEVPAEYGPGGTGY